MKKKLIDDFYFKCGDKYVHFTKYGGVNKGIVKTAGEINSIDTTNKVAYLVQYIVTQKGATLYLDGRDGQIFKVKEFLSDKTCEGIDKLGKHAQDIKSGKVTRMEAKIDQAKLIVNNSNIEEVLQKYENDTQYLMSSKANVKRLGESIEQLNKRKKKK